MKKVKKSKKRIDDLEIGKSYFYCDRFPGNKVNIVKLIAIVDDDFVIIETPGENLYYVEIGNLLGKYKKEEDNDKE